MGELNKNESLTAEELKFNQDLFNTIKEECKKLGFNKCNEKTVKDGEDAGKELAVAYECEKDGFRHLIDYTTEWSDGNLTYRVFKDNKRVNEVRWSWTYSIEEIKKAFKDIARTFNSFNESFASLNAKLEAHLNEALSNWEETYLPGTVNAIRLIAPVKFEGIDQQVVAYIFKNKEQFSHKFGYELTIENGGGSSIISNGDSDFANEAVDLCLNAIKEFDKENDTNIIYDVRPLEPSAEDIKYLDGEELKEDANLKPSISYDDREGKYVCFATENGGAVKYTDTKEEAEQFLIDKYGVKKEDIELIESFEDKTVNFMNKTIHYGNAHWLNDEDEVFVTDFGDGELTDADGDKYFIHVEHYPKDADFVIEVWYDDHNMPIDESPIKDEVSKADIEALKAVVYDELNGKNIDESINEEEKTYYLYAGYYELYLTDHKLTPPYMYQAENTDLNQLINDNISEIDDEGEWTNPDAAFSTDSATICFDKNIIDELNKTDLFGGEIDMYHDALSDAEFNGEDKDKVKEDYHIYDLSKYYADKNESMNEVEKKTAEENNAQRQLNSLKADLKANDTQDPKDKEEADKLANKATKSNKQLKSWKKAKYGESVDNFEKYAPNKDALKKCIKEGDIDGIKKIINDQKTRFNWSFGLDKKKQTIADLDIIYKAIEDASTKEIDYDEEENLKGELEKVEKYMNDILNKDFTKEDKSTKAKYLGIRKGKKKKPAVKESAEEVVARFDEGKHEIVKCSNGYYNRYNIKDGKARFTTKCVESLPTALGALKKRFPKAEEVKEKEEK